MCVLKGLVLYKVLTVEMQMPMSQSTFPNGLINITILCSLFSICIWVLLLLGYVISFGVT